MKNAFQAVWPLLISIGLIALNEMGDKSQFLAMAFATRMKLRKVLVGILFAVFVLNSLAVAVGALLASVPGWQGWVQLVSAFLFLFFGLWSLKGEGTEEIGPKKRQRAYGDVAMVFISFFFSEMGDKTQLVTISLAARYSGTPFMVLAGTTLGMLIADGIGIFVGVIVHRRLPARALRIISAVLFFTFGIVGVWQSLHHNFSLAAGTATAVALAAAVVTAAAGYTVFRKSATR